MLENKKPNLWAIICSVWEIFFCHFSLDWYKKIFTEEMEIWWLITKLVCVYMDRRWYLHHFTIRS